MSEHSFKTVRAHSGIENNGNQREQRWERCTACGAGRHMLQKWDKSGATVLLEVVNADAAVWQDCPKF